MVPLPKQEVRKLREEVEKLKAQLERMCKKVVQLNNENYSYKQEIERLKKQIESSKIIIHRFKHSKETDWNLVASSNRVPCPVCTQEHFIYIGFRGKVYGPVVLSYNEEETRAKMMDAWDLETIAKYHAFPDKLPPDAENWYYKKDK